MSPEDAIPAVIITVPATYTMPTVRYHLVARIHQPLCHRRRLGNVPGQRRAEQNRTGRYMYAS